MDARCNYTPVMDVDEALRVCRSAVYDEMGWGEVVAREDVRNAAHKEAKRRARVLVNDDAAWRAHWDKEARRAGSTKRLRQRSANRRQMVEADGS